MMRVSRRHCWLAAALVGGFLAGCASPGPTEHGQAAADGQKIPQITDLYAQATAQPQVHRFRRPLRDARDRARRQLALECDRLAADLRNDGESQAVLTDSTGESAGVADRDTRALQASLAKLGAAARRGDLSAMRTAHASALAAYRTD